MSQNFLPLAPPRAPTPPPGQNQTTNNQLLDPTAPYRGWYPRWWLLSAIFCSILIALFTIFQPFICSAKASLAPLCQINSWSDWREYLVVAVIWLVFLTGWLVGLVFGFRAIEVTKPYRSGISSVLRAMSEFKTIYGLIYILGTLAFFAIVVRWYLNWYQSIVFAYCSIVVFVAVSCFMYRCDPEERRMYISGTGFFALICAIIMLWIGPFQPVILTTEIIIAIMGISRLFRRPRQPAQSPTLTPQQILAMTNARAITPGAVFMALFYAIFRRNRNLNQPTQPTQVNQPNQPTQPAQPNPANQPTQPLSGP
ncbi:MAG: hypothetical protein ACYDER_08415 [Ktedonobacteraceae bacterium]